MGDDVADFTCGGSEDVGIHFREDVVFQIIVFDVRAAENVYPFREFEIFGYTVPSSNEGV